MQRLPDTEFEIMDLIWNSQPPVTTGTVMETMGLQRGWKLQTVVTLFGRLCERGFLRVEKGIGRSHLYYPLISRQDYLTMETEAFLDRYHKRSVVSLLASLNDADLTDADIAELRAFVRGAAKGGDGHA